MGYLFAANAFVWGAIIFYVFSLMKRNQTLQRDLELLKNTLQKENDS